jgi:hypothetical protein
MPKPRNASLGRYLREAFLYHWNLLFFGAGVAVSLISGKPDVLLPLVAAGELAYLGGLVAMPKFRTAIDAKVYKEGRVLDGNNSAEPSLAAMLNGLTPDARRRFSVLRARCLEMSKLARGVQGQSTSHSNAGVHALRAPGLNRLLWVFLRLLHSQGALLRFLQSTDKDSIEANIANAKRQLENAGEADERVHRSLTDTLATAELRLENYEKAEKNAAYVALELDRIEAKIQALVEMTVNRQDPDFISDQVDTVADSFTHTEKAIEEMRLLTGLADSLNEPPEILESDPTEDAFVVQ